MTNDPSRTGQDQGVDPETAEVGRAGPGQRLREKRESLGWPLEQAAHELRILTSILKALEEDRYEVLEAAIFVRGHLRNYARLLGLPPEEIVAAYEATQSAEDDPEIRLAKPNGPAMDGRTPAWVFPVAWLVVLSMIVMGGLWWYAGPHRDLPMDQDADDRAVERLVEAERADEAGQAPSGDGSDAVDTDLMTLSESASLEIEREFRAAEEGLETESGLPVPTEDADDETRSGDALEEPRPRPTETETETQAELSAPATITPSDAEGLEGARRLVIEMQDDSWLEIHDSRDAQLFYGLAQEGRRLEFHGVAPIDVFMGNAPAIRLSVDGDVVDFSNRVRRDNTARVVVPPPSE